MHSQMLGDREDCLCTSCRTHQRQPSCRSCAAWSRGQMRWAGWHSTPALVDPVLNCWHWPATQFSTPNVNFINNCRSPAAVWLMGELLLEQFAAGSPRGGQVAAEFPTAETLASVWAQAMRWPGCNLLGLAAMAHLTDFAQSCCPTTAVQLG